MQTETTSIYLKEYLEALEKLDVQDELIRSVIAHLLGLELRPKLPTKSEQVTPRNPDGEDTSGPDDGDGPGPTRPPLKQNADTDALHSELHRLPDEKKTLTLSVEALPEGPSEEHIEPPPLMPLFKPHWTRGILSTALATLSGEGELDTETIVDALAEKRILERIPRYPLPTLRYGVQVLVDRSQAMVPFHRDQECLVDEIRKVVGNDKTQVLRFVTTPLRKAGTGARWNWKNYQPPPPGTTVLLLTDLGIGRPPLSNEWGSVDEWLEFASVVRRAKCPIVAFVPYRIERCSEKLQQVMTILNWDHQTSANTIRNRVGLGHKVQK